MVWLHFKRHYCKAKVSNTAALFRSRRPEFKKERINLGDHTHTHTLTDTHTLSQELSGGFTSLLVKKIKASVETTSNRRCCEN